MATTDPTPAPTEAPTPAPTQAPAPAPALSLPEQQLAATLALVAANNRLAAVHEALVALQGTPYARLALISAQLIPWAVAQHGETLAPSCAVTMALRLMDEANNRNIDR